MNEETRQKLAASLTAENIELLPFLPYLLQDLWELGGSPQIAAGMLRKHGIGPGARLLDLACGKGAIAVRLAQQLGTYVKGIDLLEDFIKTAREKAAEHGVEPLCCFEVADVNEAVQQEQGYDAVVFSAAGNVLGPPPVMLQKLKQTIKPGGCILLDESYLAEKAAGEQRYQNYEVLPRTEWTRLFEQAGLKELECLSLVEEEQREIDRGDLAAIEGRVKELSAQYPRQKALFESYLKSQKDEVYDIENNYVNVVWLLQNK